MSEPDSEQIILKQKLHWGVFVVPATVFVSCGFLTLIPMFFLSLATAMFGQRVSFPFGSLVWLFAALPGLVILLLTITSYLKSEITLTQTRLMFRTGLLSRRSGEIALRNIESIFLIEPLLGRVLGYGKVVVTGTGGTPFSVSFLRDAQALHFELQRAVKGIPSAKYNEEGQTPPPPMDDSQYMPKG